MSKNYFYLIAKENNGPGFKIININNNEIYMNDRDVDMRMLTLPKIDLFTCRFKNEDELKEYLVNTGRLDNCDYSIHIGKRSGKDISFLNTIYGDRPNFLSIAFNADQGILGDHVSETGSYYNDFFKRVYNDLGFANFVYHDFTNISNKFIKSMKVCGSDFKGLCGAKFDNGGWALKSYGLVRSIEESYDSYLKFKKGESDNIGLIDMRQLLIETDKDYDPNQYSLFDYIDCEDKEKGYQYVRGKFNY